MLNKKYHVYLTEEERKLAIGITTVQIFTLYFAF